MQCGVEAGDSRKRLDKLAQDIRFDDEHIDDNGDDHNYHNHNGYDEGRKVAEVVSVDDTGDNDPGFNHMSAADTQAEEEKEAGSLNIGENTITNKTVDHDKYLSRGALYRKRYYGRY